jgi:hypothetical protein
MTSSKRLESFGVKCFYQIYRAYFGRLQPVWALQIIEYHPDIFDSIEPKKEASKKKGLGKSLIQNHDKIGDAISNSENSC